MSGDTTAMSPKAPTAMNTSAELRLLFPILSEDEREDEAGRESSAARNSSTQSVLREMRTCLMITLSMRLQVAKVPVPKPSLTSRNLAFMVPICPVL